MTRHSHPRAIALTLVLLASAALSHRAQAGEPSPSWNLLVGNAVTDTLDAPLSQALAAGRWVLDRDHWTLEPGDSLSGKLVTQWKPVHHPLVHMVAGEARVRIAVRMRAVAAGRTEVSLQGGIATESNLQGSPVVGLARTAGEHECHGYFDEVRGRLADQRVARADAAGGGSAVAPAASRR